MLSICIVIPTVASQIDDIHDLIADSDPFALAMIMEKPKGGQILTAIFLKRLNRATNAQKRVAVNFVPLYLKWKAES